MMINKDFEVFICWN